MKAGNSFVTKSLLFVMLPSLVVFSFSDTGLAGEVDKTFTAGNNSQFPSIVDIPAAKLEKLAQKKIYFGHHSVGANIIDGMRNLMIESPDLEMNIMETINKSDFTMGLFAHSGVGKNMDPQSKIDDFVHILNSGVGSATDIAGFKFCYVDMLLNADVGGILNEYDNSIEDLKKKFPDLKIIHFTVPLGQQKTTWKHLVKKTFRVDDPWRYGPNINRNEYNRQLIEKYQGKDPIFDIAKIESTYPDGTRSSFQIKGKTYYSLVPKYTSDGGHLNDLGQRIVAEQLIVFLAMLD